MNKVSLLMAIPEPDGMLSRIVSDSIIKEGAFFVSEQASMLEIARIHQKNEQYLFINESDSEIVPRERNYLSIRQL
jgi:hypothetical protein